MGGALPPGSQAECTVTHSLPLCNPRPTSRPTNAPQRDQTPPFASAGGAILDARTSEIRRRSCKHRCEMAACKRSCISGVASVRGVCLCPRACGFVACADRPDRLPRGGAALRGPVPARRAGAVAGSSSTTPRAGARRRRRDRPAVAPRDRQRDRQTPATGSPPAPRPPRQRRHRRRQSRSVVADLNPDHAPARGDRYPDRVAAMLDRVGDQVPQRLCETQAVAPHRPTPARPSRSLLTAPAATDPPQPPARALVPPRRRRPPAPRRRHARSRSDADRSSSPRRATDRSSSASAARDSSVSIARSRSCDPSSARNCSDSPSRAAVSGPRSS